MGEGGYLILSLFCVDANISYTVVPILKATETHLPHWNWPTESFRDWQHLLSHGILWLGNFIGVGRSLFLASTEVSSLDWPAVRLNPNLPPFGDVCLDRNTIAGRASPCKLRLARLNLGGFWLAQWRNTKVGCLVILRKLMCYSLSASKDQEVCALCVAEKFFTY